MSHNFSKDTSYKAVETINEVKEWISTTTTCAEFKGATLRHYNVELLKKIGFSDFSEKELQKYFAEFEPLPENLSDPLALAYHGHQFGHYNPDIGDGRGFLYAQYLTEDGKLLDLGTKGSGQTAYSRTGDGRLTLKGGVREVLATEMLEAHGVNTSKSLTLFETHEQLHRGDEPSPARSAVFVRMSHSHIRFGTFQRLAYLEDKVGLEQLIEYCVRHYHPETQREAFEETVLAFFRKVISVTADMIASWMACGFVHGVMNTDNMVITGESFDYGPYRFLPESDPNFVAAYFDEGGRYRFGRQPEAGLWNLTQFAGCLLPFTDVSSLESALEEYVDVYRQALERHAFRRLGIAQTETEADGKFIQDFLGWMTLSKADFEQVFFDWYGGAESQNRAKNSPQSELYETSDFDQIRTRLFGYSSTNSDALNTAYFQAKSPVTLLIDDVEKIWSSIDKDDDWSDFQQHIECIREYSRATN